MTVLVCPVRPGEKNEELRYALRSWETNLILPDLRLVIVGHCPAWLKPDEFIPGNKYASAPLAVFDNVRLAAQWLVSEPEVIYMNDDFFCMDPVGSILPVKRNCTLADQVRAYPINTSHWWPKSLYLTLSWLQGQGFPQPESYEAHRPLLAAPQEMLDALHKWLDDGNRTEDGGLPDSVPQWRTLYGVLNQIHAYPVRDAKLGVRTPGVGTPWLSTSDESWRRYAGPMQKRFQKPSRWEISTH